jgi:hypothetical protein
MRAMSAPAPRERETPATQARASLAEAPSGAAAPQPPSLPGIDLLRLFAVLAIVWFHAGGPHSEYLSFRLPTVALVTSFVLSRAPRWSPRRVLVAWGIWFALYLVATLYRTRGVPWSSIPELRPWQLALSGPAPHLWYAPFAVLAGWVVHRHATASPRAILAAAIFTSAGVKMLSTAPAPAPQWGMVLPAIPIGMLLAHREAPAWMLAVAAASSALAVGPRYAVAIGLVLLASRWEGQRLRRLSELGRGVYWSHVLVVLALHKVGVTSPWLALLGAAAVASGLSLSPWGRKAL